MRPLDGRRVALLEARKQRELAELVTRLGGTPVCAPAVREVAIDADIAPLLTRIVEGRYDIAIVLTAAAFATLCDEADRQGRLSDVRDALAGMLIACRGPKPQLALRKQSLSATVVTAPPHTSADLLEALADTSLDGRRALLLHYGERNDRFGAALTERGAIVDDACLYEWKLPEDVEPIEAVVRGVLNDEFDAVLFTSQVQCRHLFQIASRMNADAELTTALRRDVVVAAIGPICASALRDIGIVPDVMPDLPNSPSLVRAVADYFSLTTPSVEDFA